MARCENQCGKDAKTIRIKHRASNAIEQHGKSAAGREASVEITVPAAGDSRLRPPFLPGVSECPSQDFAIISVEIGRNEGAQWICFRLRIFSQQTAGRC